MINKGKTACLLSVIAAQAGISYGQGFWIEVGFYVHFTFPGERLLF